MGGQKHPPESEALRPKVVDALKVVILMKRMTTNDNETYDSADRDPSENVKHTTAQKFPQGASAALPD